MKFITKFKRVDAAIDAFYVRPRVHPLMNDLTYDTSVQSDPNAIATSAQVKKNNQAAQQTSATLSTIFDKYKGRLLDLKGIVARSL